MKWTISQHAVDRFRQRARPLSRKRARNEIEELIKRAEWHDDAPEWAGKGTPCDGFLVIAGLAFPVQGRTISTCLSRGTIPDAVREARRQWKKERRERLARRRGL